MQPPYPVRFVGLFGLFCGCAIGGVSVAQAARWKPITPEELAAAAPRIDPEAGVEILLREESIDDQPTDMTGYQHYVRLKVFNERGVEALDKIEILDTPANPVREVAARVIKPDGSIIDVDRRAIYTREVMRRGSMRVRVKSFSFPALAPGCIVEYQWRERGSEGVHGVQLMFRREFPAWVVRFRYRPFPYSDSQFSLLTLAQNYPLPELRPDRAGFFAFEMADVPAARDEPWMPPEEETQPSLTFYFRRSNQTPEDYWIKYGVAIAEIAARATRPDRAIRDTATRLAGDAPDANAALTRLHNFCRTQIRNLHRTNSGFTSEESAQLKDNKTAAETLARGYGTPYDINLLFVALAGAAGFEARFVALGDRSRRMFRPELTTYAQFPNFAAAVLADGNWRFFDPGSTYLAAGSLPWQNEGVMALVSDAKDPLFVRTPVTSRNVSKVVRHASLTLDEAGTLEGVIVQTYYGHGGIARKWELAEETPEQRAVILRDEVRTRLGAAEVSDVLVQHAEDPLAPVSVSYRVRVPGYAEQAGRRLLVQPAFFQKGARPVFPADTREFDIHFPFPWTEEDRVVLTVPPSFAPEEASAPASLDGGQVAAYDVRLAWKPANRQFVYERTFGVGGIIFPVRVYGALRNFFAEQHRQDQHAVFVRRAEDTAAASP